MGKKLWVKVDIPKNGVEELTRKFNFPRPVALFLLGRGIKPKDVESFLKAPLKGLSDPYRFPDAKVAVARLWDAISKGEKILIHGDYDTDGITATVLMDWVLRTNGANVSTFLPHRFDDGYGFTPDSLDKAFENCASGCGVLVTVDCGITSTAAVDSAREQGIDVIITDHHEPAEEMPDALAIINPKINPELADLQVLSGVGVAFKLCHAFIKYGRENKLGGFKTNLQETLDLVALGTIADIVPLLGENRILVKHGIKELGKQLRPGIKALFDVAKVKTKVSPADVTFKLAPRLNAAGRLGNADAALNLLKTDSILDAYTYADSLEKFNIERQTTEEVIFNEAIAQIKERIDTNNCLTILVAGKNWHQGVIGIVASRLSREYNRPAIVLTIQDGEAYGSGRGMGSLNMVEALTECSHLLTRFGGHPMAVGLGLKSENIEEFFILFEKIVNEQLTQTDLVDQIQVDGDVTFDELDYRFFDLIENLGPFGHSNPQPIFLIQEVEPVKVFPIGQNHSRGILRDRSGYQLDFIAFNRPMNSLPDSMWDILATPQVNEFRGERKPQVQIVDLRPSY